MTTLSSLLPPANLGNVTGTLAAANGGTGLTSPGSAGNILTSDGTNWTSAPAPASGPSLEAIASGSLSNGAAVVVNSDGTVSVISGVSQVLGTPTLFTSNVADRISATYDQAQQKIVIAYRDSNNANYGTAVVGTVSGTSISFGTPVVFESANTPEIGIAYDANAQKVVITYYDAGNSEYGTAIVGTVSGTSISFGTAVVFKSAQTRNPVPVYDSDNQKVVIAYRNAQSARGEAIVGTVSGTSISFGTFANMPPTATASYYYGVAYDTSAQKVVIAYQGPSTSFTGRAIVGTVSGTSISFGSEVVFNNANTPTTSMAYDSENSKVVIAYANGGNSNFGTAIVGTVSGTSISFGTPVVFESATTNYPAIVYDTNARKVVIAYADGGNSNFGTAIVGTVSGTSISFAAPIVYESASTLGVNYEHPIAYDSTQKKVVIAYTDVGNSSRGTAVVLQNESTNLTSENFIGFSDAAYTNGQTATVQIVGAVDDAQSGLTAGQAYYVQTDGSIGLTPANPSVFAGTAVSANKIIVKG